MRKGRQPLTAWTRRAAGRIRRALGGRTVGAVSALLTGTGIALLAAALSGTASSPSTRPVVAPGARAPGDRG
ncbi:MAG: hypothetical protein N3A38_14205, partial [Planctomycetota bacterium]|nr:hypothetical protein [Planctomycetota bacterium]